MISLKTASIFTAFGLFFVSCQDKKTESPKANSGSGTSQQMSDKELRETRVTHGALAQYHRWFQLYERPLTDERLNRQLEILSPEVEINSIGRAAKGHQEYLKEVHALPKEAKNAHHVQSTKVTQQGDKLMLTAKVRYEREQPDGTLAALNLKYDTRLTKKIQGSPIFEAINISVESPAQTDKFHDAYVENRVKSFIHQWLYLVEAVDGKSEGFRELLSKDKLSLAFSSKGEPISNFKEFDQWNQGAPKMLKASSHLIENLDFSGEKEINLTVEFDWRALSLDGKKITGRTHHTWMLEDTGERFLRLKTAKVKWLEPMTISE